MNIYNSLKNINKLSKTQLIHCVLLMNIEIQNYEFAIKNYDEKKMKKYGTPYLNKLIDMRNKFQSSLDSLQ
jgi:hypothetical protein